MQVSEGQFVASSPDEKVILIIIVIITIIIVINIITIAIIAIMIIIITITIIVVIKAILEFCRESRIIFNGEFIDHKVGWVIISLI